ncbi:spore coat associated protein CotJA [Eubacteriales bacterium OttesenSCG-928-G02]|nr:spore coat associated protein CotJA [Eubacteriales bacterium OttesenSCG-928-G02]
MQIFDFSPDCDFNFEPLMQKNNRIDNTDNIPNTVCSPKNTLAMAYVPYQEFESLYDYSQALENGTLFMDLNFPFLGKRGK